MNTHFWKFLSFMNLPVGYVKSHTNFGPDRFRRFDVYWIQTDRQAKYIIDNKRFTQLGCKEIGKRKF